MGFRNVDITFKAECTIIEFLKKLKPSLTLRIKFFKVLAKSQL